jgi:hypothetical protein
MKGSGRKAAVLACVLLFLGLCLSPAVGADETTTGYETENVEVETGTSPFLGGGDYVQIKFKADALFGVLYGTDEYPNSIIIYALHTRFLGGANAYDENGALVAQRVPIIVFTLFAQKLQDIFEFNDTNGDGIATYNKTGAGLFYQNYIEHEPIYKGVSLTTAWNRSELIELSDPEADERSWEFSLTATNLSYFAVGDSGTIDSDVQNEVLEKVEFTFHLEASYVKVKDQPVPYYRVTVRKEDGQGAMRRYTVMESERVQDRLVSGKRGVYEVKYDHLIQGWDYDPTNQNRMLVLENHLIVGNLIPAQTAEWIRAQFMKDLGGNGKMTYQTGEGMKEADEDSAVGAMEPVPGLPQKLTQRHITCKANWEEIGKLTWVSNVMVDGQEREMYAQVQGFQKIGVVGPLGNAFSGFIALAGFSYPGGDSIYHDPSVSSEALVEMTIGPDTIAFPLGLALLMVGIIAAVIIIAALAAYSSSKGKEKRYFSDSFESYELPKETPPSDEGWQRYYGKR